MRKWKVLIAESVDFSPEALQMLQQYFEVDTPAEKPSVEEALSAYDVVWFRFGYVIDEQCLPSSLRCKVIVVPATGTDHIDLDAVQKRGIVVLSLKGEREFLRRVRATAELTIGLCLALQRKICPAHRDVLSGHWNRDAFRGRELYEKRVGIVGMGRLGQIVAGYFSAFGCRVQYCDTREVEVPYRRVDSLVELAAQSDILSLHVPLSEETVGLIGEEVFRAMPNHGILINTSRGAIVDEAALLRALEEGHIAGAALDVVREERQWSANRALAQYARHHDNFLIVPHIGGNTYESFDRTERFMAQKLIEWYTSRVAE